MRIAVVHGFNVSDGGDYLRPWQQALSEAGHDAYLLSYGWVGPLRVRLENLEVVRQLERDRPDAIIGHSNGAAIGWQYLMHGNNLDSMICVQPALNVQTAWPWRVRRIVTLYNPGDWAVIWGRRWRRFNPVSWFRRHYWGAAGNAGFAKSDTRFRQFNTAIDPLFPYRGHSVAQLSDSGVRYWTAQILIALNDRRARDDAICAVA